MIDPTVQHNQGLIFNTLAVTFSLYIMIYSLLSIWLLFDGLTNKFSSLYWLWGVDSNTGFTGPVTLLLFTALGAILGGAILNIISFHKYFSVEKNFDVEYFWGFFFTPILSLIVGILIFSLVQGGLLVLNGSITDSSKSINSALGFTAIGSIAGYNWDIFIRKLQDMSKILNQKTQ